METRKRCHGRNRILRIATCGYLALLALTLWFFLAFAPPKSIYLRSAELLGFTAFGWLISAEVGFVLSVPLLAGLTQMMVLVTPSAVGWVFFAGAYLLVGGSLYGARCRMLPIMGALVLTLTWFAIDHQYSRVWQVKRYDMGWNLEGQGPWGRVGYEGQPPFALIQNGEPLVLVYRQVADGYCWSVAYSREVASRLAQEPTKAARVEYNTFWDFGDWAGDTVKSIDGIQLYERDRPLKPTLSYLGGHHATGEMTIGLCQ